MITPEQIADFANELTSSGYLKPWKAASMFSTLRMIPEILKNKTRAINYLEGCLLMENFTKQDCEKVYNFLIENWV